MGSYLYCRGEKKTMAAVPTGVNNKIYRSPFSVSGQQVDNNNNIIIFIFPSDNVDNYIISRRN